MSSPEETSLVARLAVRHGCQGSLRALRAGGGTMAQFSRPEFDGMAQWSPGMTMVGDMFNERLKIKLDAVATALAAFLRQTEGDRSANDPNSAFHQAWPASLESRALAAPKTIYVMPFSQLPPASG